MSTVDRLFVQITGVQSFSWPSTSVGLTFRGTSLQANLSASCTGDRFQVLVDGVESHTFQVYGPWRLYTVASDLSGGTHTVQLVKTSEASLQVHVTETGAPAQDWHKGAVHFGGLVLPRDATVLPAPPPPHRLLEVIGDSDTAGYCVDGPYGSTDGSFKPAAPPEDGGRALTQAQYETWAGQVAHALKATLVVQAVSGIGVIHRPYVAWWNSWELGNCSRPMPESADNATWLAGEPEPYMHGPWVGSMLDYVDNVNVFNPVMKVDYSTEPIPDAILILIGPNDFNKTSMPNPRFGPLTEFKTNYGKLLESRVRAYSHGAVKPAIISVCGGSITGFLPCPYIQDVIKTFNQGRHDGFKAYFVSMEEAVWTTLQKNKEYNGCDHHYNKRGHGVVASQVLPQLRHILGWCENSNTSC